jgi:hypothetical protein
VIAYRELRLLELDILRVVYGKAATLSLDVSQFNILCDVDQFFGIEIEEFPAQIAQTALWLMDHQMNMRVSEEFGNYFVRLPLKKSATIVHGNALQLDWREIVKPSELSYILGNPPFGGKKEQSEGQKQDLMRVFRDVPGAGVLDFVAAWYRKAVEFMADNPAVKTAFVSTNSISQGEQVGILWGDLLKRGVKFHFAHRTFQWSSEARGKAAVHCVIIGFALFDTSEKWLFDYETPHADPHAIKAGNINPYLVDAPTIFIVRRSLPVVSAAPEMDYGSMPIDNGNLIFNEQEGNEFLKMNPKAKKYLRKYLGGKEFINSIARYCLWLVGCDPSELRQSAEIMRRIEENKKYRLSSDRPQTKELAKTPALFGEIRQPSRKYLLVPKVSAEIRDYIPIGFCLPDVIASGSALIIPTATLYHFGVLASAMHMGWTRTVCGRMKSDYQYSAGIVYNNFPWPQAETTKQRQTIDEAAQGVLDARAKHPDSCLADLYDPLTMPPDLVKAHHKLDAAVDAAYSKKKFSGDSDRVAFLFELYQQMSSPLESKKTMRRKAVRYK